MRKKYGIFPQCDLITSPQEMSKSSKFNKTLLSLKRINVKLIKTLCINEISESFFLPQPSAIDSFHYPGYVKRLQKERQKQAKEKK